MSDIVLINGMRHTVWVCRSCGCVATCPESLEQEFKRSGGFRSCPNGHMYGWKKEDSENEQIRRERDRLRQQLAARDDDVKWYKDRREEAERRAAAARGQVTKIKNRVGKGVCPCCNRFFVNLHNHIKTQHPTFSAEAAE